MGDQYGRIGVPLHSLLKGAEASAGGGLAGPHPPAGTVSADDGLEEFLAEAIAAATGETSMTAAAPSSALSPALSPALGTALSSAPLAHAEHCDAVLWLLGLTGQLLHAVQRPTAVNGQPARAVDDGERLWGSQISMRPPEAAWSLLHAELWGGTGLAALVRRHDELRAAHGSRAVRAGVTALLGPDAQWLLGHRSCDGLPRGVSSYRFCRLPPLRAALEGEGSSALRGYALQVAPDAVPAWQQRVQRLRAKELKEVSHPPTSSTHRVPLEYLSRSVSAEDHP